ncbi:MAG: type II toxin-antitoxin system HipA family toxin [Acidiferrobacter sp.]
MAINSTAVVEVRLWGHRVGACSLDPRSGFYAFEYDRAFVRRGIDLAPLQMPIARADRPMIFPGLPENTYHRLPALLADALPDAFGNALVDAYLAQRGLNVDEITPLDRLTYMGRRGFGALEFHPITGPNRKANTALEMAALVEQARRAFAGQLSDQNNSQSLRHLFQIGTSAGGARAKAVVAWNPDTQELRAGQFDVDPGFQHWLLKFDGMGRDQELGTGSGYGRIEYAYHLMARDAGITMQDCRLLEEDGRAHFMTRRFDRQAHQKHHMQSLCAMGHLDFRLRAAHAYEQMFQVFAKLNLPPDDYQQGFLRMAMNIMASNCDDHTKNVSFLLEEGKPWRLAPAYDLTYAYNPKGEWTYQHLMSVSGKFSDITKADLLKIADQFAIPEPYALLKQVRTVIQHWPDYAEKSGVRPDTIDTIGRHIVSL